MRRILFRIHTYNNTQAEAELQLRALHLPRVRSSWLMREASVLLDCNNRHITNALLLHRLRAFSQAYRYLIHSGYNMGYLCGELHSMAVSARVWLRFDYVVHTHLDSYMTPEAVLRIGNILQQGLVDLLIDVFPASGSKQGGLRYAMELFAFRTRAAKLPHDSTLQASPTTVFSKMDQACRYEILIYNKALTFPERWLFVHFYADNRHNRGKINITELGMLRRLPPGEGGPNQRDSGDKTFIFPGAIWHTHNVSRLNAYLLAEESRRDHKFGPVRQDVFGNHLHNVIDLQRGTERRR